MAVIGHRDVTALLVDEGPWRLALLVIVHGDTATVADDCARGVPCPDAVVDRGLAATSVGFVEPTRAVGAEPVDRAALRRPFAAASRCRVLIATAILPVGSGRTVRTGPNGCSEVHPVVLATLIVDPGVGFLVLGCHRRCRQWGHQGQDRHHQDEDSTVRHDGVPPAAPLPRRDGGGSLAVFVLQRTVGPQRATLEVPSVDQALCERSGQVG